jgi:alkylhydroperoxidase/carboxymuconolactone decarboxylase family protein YurZ
VTRPWQQHYQEIMGFVPPGTDMLYAIGEEFGDCFIDLREAIFRERPDGLSRAMKELLLTVLDIAANNPNALQHLKSARRAGLTRTQLCEALMAVFLICGVSGLAHSGAEGLRMWDAAQKSG